LVHLDWVRNSIHLCIKLDLKQIHREVVHLALML